MRTLTARLAAIGAIVSLLAVAPRMAAAFDYSTPGRLYGGVETGVLIPLNAFNRYNAVGGSIAPFIGYKIFTDQDLQPNIGPVGQVQFFGAGQQDCTQCPKTGHTLGAHDNDAYAFAYHAGPRLTLPIGPVELFGDWQIGGESGFNQPTSITHHTTAWGFTTGAGLSYSLNENVLLGLFGRYDWYDQEVHRLGKLVYSTAGVVLTFQQSPPYRPAPAVAQVPPPAVPPSMKQKIVLRGVNFDFNKSNIRADAQPILEQACRTLRDQPSINVSCDGYTDSIGSDSYNLGLSLRRAHAVRDWLVKCGISPSRLTTRGFGESNPVATNDTAEGRAQNRRTELVVTN